MAEEFINHLIEILNISKKYNFVEADNYISKLNRMINFNIALSEEIIKKIMVPIKEYKQVLVDKDYNYFNNNKVDLYEKDITDFFTAKWKSFDQKDKSRIFHLLKKMYNLGIKI